MSSRHVECPFSITAKLANENTGPWVYEIHNAEHNHPSSIAASHPVLRRMAMTREVKSEISRQLTVRTTPFQIISGLCAEPSESVVAEATNPQVSNSTTSDPTNSRNSRPDPAAVATSINPMFKPRDIYNMQARIRRDQLGPYSPTQALMRQLDQRDWFFAYQNDRTGRLTHLFFFKEISQTLLKTNHEVLIIDCIYKTNRYKMPLLIITGQTALHKTFYVAFCFISKEKIQDYKWVLQQLKDLYAKWELPFPVVIITDMEKGLMFARQLIFPTIKHLLCLWHINKNVLTHCKKDFRTKND